jgi:MFS family permease
VIFPIIIGVALVAAFIWHALRADNPLLNVRLYKRSTYAAASVTTFWLGASLFGAMILLPLYYQQLRGQSVVDTGLLLGPQGLGMALLMPMIGRLTDRFGGGPLALGGVILTTVASIPFGLIGMHTSIVELECVLLVRGVGIGFAFMPAFVAAFAALERHEVADATPQLNVLMRVGGSIGTAVLAVVLARSLAGSHNPAGAYGDAFWWSAGMSAAAIVPTFILLRSERAIARAKRDDEGPGIGEELPLEAVGV